MADISRTISYLQGTAFVAGQPAGSITSQRVRDFVATLQTRTRGSYRVTDSEFGAFGDGSSHVASSVYGSLGALQAVYGVTISGVTVALTQELDWLATQFAINTAAAAGGGCVFFPGHGPYVFSNSNSVSDGSGGLVLPVTSTAPSGNGPGVDLHGEGMMFTILRWPSDLGTGKAAISCGPVTATFGNATGRFGFNFYEGFISDLTVKGPGGTVTRGTPPANMTGLMLGARRHCQRVISDGFNKAIDFVGDLTEFETVYGLNSYYGFYLGDSNVNLFGDTCFRRCMFTQNAMAGVAISKNASWNTAADDCFFGNNPYGILFESGAPNSYGQPDPAQAIAASTFNHCGFESSSNGFIMDDNATAGGGGNTGTRLRGMIDCTFTNCYPSFGGGAAITAGGRGTYAFVDVLYLYGVKFLNNIGGGWFGQSGMTAMIMANAIGINNSGGVIWEGNADALLATYTTAGVQVLAAPDPSFGAIGIFGNGGHRTFKMIKTGEWEGNAEYIAGATAIPKDVMVERVNYNAIQLGGTASAGTALIAGINKQTWAASSAGKITIVATKAVLSTVKVTAAQTNGALVKLGTAGAVVAATSVTDGQCCGYVQNNNGGSTSAIVISPAFLGSM